MASVDCGGFTQLASNEIPALGDVCAEMAQGDTELRGWLLAPDLDCLVV